MKFGAAEVDRYRQDGFLVLEEFVDPATCDALKGRMGELLDGKPTNHLDLRKSLAKTKAKDFLYYTGAAG